MYISCDLPGARGATPENAFVVVSCAFVSPFSIQKRGGFYTAEAVLIQEAGWYGDEGQRRAAAVQPCACLLRAFFSPEPIFTVGCICGVPVGVGYGFNAQLHASGTLGSGKNTPNQLD